MADDVTISTGRARLLRRLAPFFLALAGVIFTVIGGWLLYSLTWDKATGVVGECSMHSDRRAGSKTRHVEQRCEVTWQSGGHTGAVRLTMDRDDYVAGQTVALRVDGDRVVTDGPAWMGAGVAGLGVVLVGIGGVLIVRGRASA